MTKIATRIYSALALIAAFLWFAAGTPLYLNVSDDGGHALDAVRILSGEIPYRDFPLLTTPAHSYMLALVYSVFGKSLMAERLLNAGVLSFIPLLLFLAMRRTFGGAWAALAWLLSAVWLGRMPHLTGGLPAAIALTLGSFICLIAAERDRTLKHIAGAGALAAAAWLFRQDIAAYAMAATGFFFYLRRRERYEPLGRDLKRYALGAAAVLAAPVLYFIAKAPGRELFYDLVYYPLFVYTDYSKLYFPSLTEGFRSFLSGRSQFFGYLELLASRLAFYLVPLVLAAAWAGLIARWRKLLYASESNMLVLFTLAGFFSLNQLFRRPDAYHLTAAFIFSLPPALWLARRALRASAGPDRANLIIACLFLAGLFIVPAALQRAREIRDIGKDPFRLRVKGAESIRPLPRNTREAQLWNNYAYAVNYVKHYTGPNQPIFVGSIRHDRFCAADPLFYFLAERPPATRHHRMIRGVVTHPDVQREIVRELETKRVALIVLRKDLDDCCTEPNLSARARPVTVLDDYLKTRYSVKTKFGGNWILERVW